MPRVSVPPYPIAGGVDDLDEDTPPIIPQFTGETLEYRMLLYADDSRLYLPLNQQLVDCLKDNEAWTTLKFK